MGQKAKKQKSFFCYTLGVFLLEPKSHPSTATITDQLVGPGAASPRALGSKPVEDSSKAVKPFLSPTREVKTSLVTKKQKKIKGLLIEEKKQHLFS